jgi:predicted DNA binding protein
LIEILEFESAQENPIYKGEFEIFHEDCVFVEAAERLDVDLDIEILFGNQENSFEKVRSSIPMPLEKSTINNILSPLYANQNLKYARFWVNGGTVFELFIHDKALNVLKQVRSVPFGSISSYMATYEAEKVSILSPSSKNISGKEKLLDFEEELKSFGEAELLSFNRAEKKDLIKKITSSNFSTPWLSLGDIRIISTAIREGYFETPRRATLDDLSMILNIKRSKLSQKLRLINRQVLGRFFRELKEPLPP